jgi:hypothetical protein
MLGILCLLLSLFLHLYDGAHNSGYLLRGLVYGLNELKCVNQVSASIRVIPDDSHSSSVK